MEERRKFHIKQAYNLYVRHQGERAGHVIHVGKNAFKILKRLLKRSEHKSEDNINMDLTDIYTGFLSLTIMGSCEYTNQLLSSMRGGKFLNYWSD